MSKVTLACISLLVACAMGRTARSGWRIGTICAWTAGDPARAELGHHPGRPHGHVVQQAVDPDGDIVGIRTTWWWTASGWD